MLSAASARFFWDTWILLLEFKCLRKAGGPERRAAAQKRGPQGRGGPASPQFSACCSPPLAPTSRVLQPRRAGAAVAPAPRAGRGWGQAPETLALAGFVTGRTSPSLLTELLRRDNGVYLTLNCKQNPC